MIPDIDEPVELAAVDPAHFWFAARNRLIAWMLAHHAPSARTFFETGCGTGSVLRGLAALLPGLRLTGAEVSIPSLQLAAAAAPTAALVYADTRHLPYDGEFDAAGASRSDAANDRLSVAFAGAFRKNAASTRAIGYSDTLLNITGASSVLNTPPITPPTAIHR